MIRELVRRSCGHLETVSVFGNSGRWIDRALRKKEQDICGICRYRQKELSSGEEDEGKSPKDAGQYPTKEEE